MPFLACFDGRAMTAADFLHPECIKLLRIRIILIYFRPSSQPHRLAGVFYPYAVQQAVNTNLFSGLPVASIYSSPRFALREVAWLVSLSCSACVVQAQTASAPAVAPVQIAAATLKAVVISGSRTEQAAEDLPMTMDVINAKDIEEGQIHDIRDVVKDIPNVSVRRAPARFGLAQGDTGREGNAGFNIRGLDGNRVLMMVDGIRLPRSYSFGVNSFGRDSLSIDLVKRIEIVKGPSSVLYGSDGIAGLVNFVTYEPSDFLQGGKTFGGRASISYSGDDKGVAGTATLAGRASEVLDWQITAASNRADGLKNMGDRDTQSTNRQWQCTDGQGRAAAQQFTKTRDQF